MKQGLIFVWLTSTLMSAAAQAPDAVPAEQSVSAPTTSAALSLKPSSLATSYEILLDFKPTDIKFSLENLMAVLRDKQHEGWVLTAYPDPKTRRPLIGAGFGLDVAATDHPQTDALNPHPFIEPSSAELWQAAGLDANLLPTILDRFDRNMETWSKKKYRRKIKAHSLRPDITQEEATRLLRISSIQAVQNARAYCRDFDKLNGLQQMALSQLVFQMGVNLEGFVQFLSTLNGSDDTFQSQTIATTESDHWKAVQHTLIDSDWARRYTSRATTVIAMFDPDYLQDPGEAERLVAAELPPPARHHHHKKRRSLQSKQKTA
ncbi:hypothetical protein [Alloacidobacterium sp.]|uniref:hypothetical protein n=1 Tax=Alloacidobacterium sp. TaxID=2951999 RepID=UPI002D670E75|nr:hypothetical protein [Alloacidobacterium sp.]HYK36680.1 hypothetical protein [Alloacidobacterium sp.]